MTRQVLGETARAEILKCMEACGTRKKRAAEAARLAEHFQCNKDRIYEVSKAVRPKQKVRADKGNRKVDIRTDEQLRLVAGWVLEYDVSPAEAINMARDRGMTIEIEFPTLVKYLRENGLDKKSRRNPVTPYRRFEAKAPGEMFQFDISGLKERWYDHQTRRIISVSPLEISKNHENEKAGRTRVWRFVLVDDYSRRPFIRYVGVGKPNSSHVVDFLLQAYAELGVPLKLFTDNDKIIKFGRNARTTEILNKVMSDQGGYENIFHLPGNSRATGKVERLHQTIEQCEKFIGIYIAERGNLSLEELNNDFAAGVMQQLNNTVHSETDQTPMARWDSTFSVIRRLDYETLRSAFMADEHLVRLKGDLTFRLKGETYQLPQTELYPFADWAGRKEKLRVVFPDDLPYFTVIGFDGMDYEIPKDLYKPDEAGEFRSTRQTNAQQLRKEVRALAKADARRVRETGGRGDAEIGAAEPIRFFDSEPVAAVETGVLRFPKPELVVDASRVEREAPGRVLAHDPPVNFWEAFGAFNGRFGSKGECKAFLDTIFESRDETCWLLQSEIVKAVESLESGVGSRKQTHLRAVS